MFYRLRPEHKVIDKNILTYFRKLFLTEEDLLTKLIKKSVEIVLENGVIKSRMILIDSTHIGKRFNQKNIQNVQSLNYGNVQLRH